MLFQLSYKMVQKFPNETKKFEAAEKWGVPIPNKNSINQIISKNHAFYIFIFNLNRFKTINGKDNRQLKKYFHICEFDYFNFLI